VIVGERGAVIMSVESVAKFEHVQNNRGASVAKRQRSEGAFSAY